MTYSLMSSKKGEQVLEKAESLAFGHVEFELLVRYINGNI